MQPRRKCTVQVEFRTRNSWPAAICSHLPDHHRCLTNSRTMQIARSQAVLRQQPFTAARRQPQRGALHVQCSSVRADSLRERVGKAAVVAAAALSLVAGGECRRCCRCLVSPFREAPPAGPPRPRCVLWLLGKLPVDLLVYRSSATQARWRPCTLPHQTTAAGASARLEGVNKPELLPPGPVTPVIDIAGFLTEGEVGGSKGEELVAREVGQGNFG